MIRKLKRAALARPVAVRADPALAREAFDIGFV